MLRHSIAHVFPKEVITQRCRLRMFRESDMSPLRALILRNEPDLYVFRGLVPSAQTEESCLNLIRKYMAEWALMEKFILAIESKDNNRLIGQFFIRLRDPLVPKGEVGFYIDRSFWRKGLMTEIMTAMLEHCFLKIGFEKVFMRASTDNPASQGVAIKMGLRREGLFIGDYRYSNGVLHDTFYYAILRSEYLERTSK